MTLVTSLLLLSLSGCNLIGGKPQVEKDFSFLGFDGQSHLVSDYAGKPLVLNFWADWCPPCVGEFPHFQEVYTERQGQFNLLSVAVSQTGDIQGFVKSKGYNWHFGQDTTDAGSKLHGIQGIPATFFYNSDGKIVESVIGGMDKASFEEKLAKIL
jgi:thiol-disulfide isomerase/thioredoxin